MRRINFGAVLLSVWAALNLALAIGILFSMTVLGRPPPSLPMALSAAQVAALDPAALELVSSLAIFGNACAAALCLLALAVIWTSLVARQAWARWALAGALLPLQAMGFVSDAYLGGHNLGPNLVSTALLAAGLALAWPCAQRSPPQAPRQPA